MNQALRRAAAEAASSLLGMAPHLGPLASALAPGGLEGRLRALVPLAVARARGCPPAAALHRLGGRLAGLTPAERLGETRGLTAAERAALALALGTVSLPDPTLEAGPVDEHFTSEAIERIRALALAADLGCRAMALLPRPG